MAQHDITKLLSYAVAIGISYAIAQLTYNVFFHPLRKFPGPLINAATPFPRLWLYYNGRENLGLAALHKKYGSIVRVAPDELSFIDGAAWKDIYGTAKDINRKDEKFYPVSANGVHSILTANDADHTRMRKALLPAFSDRALRAQEGLLKTYVQWLVTGLRQKQEKGEAIDMVKMYNFTSFDIMSDLSFGEPLGALKNMEATDWMTTIFDMIFYWAFSRIPRHFPIVWAIVDFCIPKSFKDKGLASFNHTVERVNKRLEMETDRPDLVSFIMENNHGSTSVEELHSNADIFMIAGTETTSTLLSGLTCLLLQNPRVMEKLTAEIRGAFPTVDDITIDTLAALPYLAACINEAFRIYPPVPTAVRRLTNATTGAQVAGHWIPPNTSVGVPQWPANHSDKNFVDPESFIPERWVAEGTEDYDERFAGDNRQAMQPFSVGKRNCIGKNLAYHEMRLIIAYLFVTFDLNWDNKADADDWLDQKLYILWDKKPLMCKLTPVAA
uniref:CYP65EZ1 n=1 Tax=Hormonema carpetanum TaxID=284138 RepID=A0A897Q180_HORCR|nr:CYP65EZ1 [Hormonema carpetanum]